MHKSGAGEGQASWDLGDWWSLFWGRLVSRGGDEAEWWVRVQGGRSGAGEEPGPVEREDDGAAATHGGEEESGHAEEETEEVREAMAANLLPRKKRVLYHNIMSTKAQKKARREQLEQRKLELQAAAP